MINDACPYIPPTKKTHSSLLFRPGRGQTRVGRVPRVCRVNRRHSLALSSTCIPRRRRLLYNTLLIPTIIGKSRQRRAVQIQRTGDKGDHKLAPRELSCKLHKTSMSFQAPKSGHLYELVRQDIRSTRRQAKTDQQRSTGQIARINAFHTTIMGFPATL